MENISSSKAMSTILFGSLIVMLIGQLFQIQHYPYGKLLFQIGLVAYVIISLLEIDRLKKIVAKSFDANIKSD
jgi:hypothetical protein